MKENQDIPVGWARLLASTVNRVTIIRSTRTPPVASFRSLLYLTFAADQSQNFLCRLPRCVTLLYVRGLVHKNILVTIENEIIISYSQFLHLKNARS